MRSASISSVLILLCFLQVREVSATDSDAAWTLESESASSLKFQAARRQVKGERGLQAARLDVERFDLQISQPVAAGESTVIRLPNPDGQFESFRLVPANDMHPELRQWFVDQGWPMRTFKGVNVDHPDQTIRLDWGGPSGLHVSIDGAAGSWFIDPVSSGDRENYLSYHRQAKGSKDQAWTCSAAPIPKAARSSLTETQSLPSASASTGTGGMLRSFRLAVAATGEYTQFHGGAVEAQAAIVTTIARVNQIFERDLSIRMTLIANNHMLIYTNPDTDPYTNSNANSMLDQNQGNIDDVIGSANYDIGHVFSTFRGGVAYVGASCVTKYKAGGVTGRDNPEGDPFDVDLVAHEMGHQWGAEHTFNSELSACGGGNRSVNSAYEPGSGSTIMSYAGICLADNLQVDSDAYFHARSMDQMLEHAATVSNAYSCGTLTANNADAPLVDAGADQLIPIGTPFELMALPLSSEEAGESFTYTWEQWDLGQASSLADGDTGQGPLIRSLEPSVSPIRSIPSLADLQVNTQTTGVVLPATGRDLNFRATIRDNNPNGGRIGEDFITVQSIAAAGPFALSFPNDGGVLEGQQTITWDVAGTTGNGINAAEVDIRLSADDGLTWPHVLASATPNDGSETVTLPDIATTQARVRVQPVGRIFFDMSEQAFSIVVTDPQIVVLPTALNFRDVDIDAGPSGVLSLEIQNIGLTDLEVSQVSISGADAALFEITADSGETLVNPGQVRTLEIRFNPDSSGAKAAKLQINSSDTQEPGILINLRGNGIDLSDIIFRDSFEPG